MSLPKASELLLVFASVDELNKIASRYGMSPEEFRKHVLGVAQRLKAEESAGASSALGASKPATAGKSSTSKAPSTSRTSSASKSSKASSTAKASSVSGSSSTSGTRKSSADSAASSQSAKSTGTGARKATPKRAKAGAAGAQFDLGLDGPSRLASAPTPPKSPPKSAALAGLRSGSKAGSQSKSEAGAPSTELFKQPERRPTREISAKEGTSALPSKTPPRSEPKAAAFPKVIVYSDGAARGNPGPAGAGAVVMSPSGQILLRKGKFLGRQTNNVAEYEGTLLGLKAALELGAREVELRADSMLLVMQLKGEWKVKNEGLKPLVLSAKRLLAQFERYSLKHVPRELNTQADEMSNRAIDERMLG